jgi:hypothetical protein
MSLPSEEQWRAVVGYEGFYEVSDHGRVRSLPRISNTRYGRTRRLSGRILRPGINPRTGRRLVALYRDSVARTHHVYPLVLEAFVGLRPPGMEACHNDGDHTNDRLSNLRWDTSSGNSHDSVAHGTHNNARKTHCLRGHRLAEPNLVPSILARGRRDCLACHKARAKKTKRLEAKGIEVDRLALADDYYQQLTKE